jgi:hypothetical protein
MIELARLPTLKAAWMMDHHGNKAARAERPFENPFNGGFGP